MLAAICGTALIVGSIAGFWYLLPRDGNVHPVVQKLDGGAMLTITIMCVITFGIALLVEGLVG